VGGPGTSAKAKKRKLKKAEWCKGGFNQRKKNQKKDLSGGGGGGGVGKQNKSWSGEYTRNILKIERFE